jgi:AraC-like DNA-binding protein
MQVVQLSDIGTSSYIRDRKPCEQPCYSLALTRPLLDVLRGYDGFPQQAICDFEKFDLDERIPATSMHELLQAAVNYASDHDLGLKAARGVSFGDLGAFDYVMSTAPTVRAAIDTANKYRRLINDTIEFHLEIEGHRAYLNLENSVVMPRAALDFQLAVFCRNHFFNWPRTADTGYEVCLAYNEPLVLDQYERTFRNTPVRFSAPFSGYVFAATDLDRPLQNADTNLHTVMQKYAAITLANLPKAQSVTEKVRELLAADLSSGGPYAKRVSQSLNMSARTLIRRLEHEGTSFKEILDEIRRRLALNYMGNRDLDLADTACLLGFSHTTAFHRAFKRWTGQTPLDYRHSRRR